MYLACVLVGHYGTGILFEEPNPTGSPRDLIGLCTQQTKPHPPNTQERARGKQPRKGKAPKRRKCESTETSPGDEATEETQKGQKEEMDPNSAREQQEGGWRNSYDFIYTPEVQNKMVTVVRFLSSFPSQLRLLFSSHLTYRHLVPGLSPLVPWTTDLCTVYKVNWPASGNSLHAPT